MLSPKHKRYADRMRVLIQEGHAVAKLERDSSVGPYIQDRLPLHSWLTKVENIIETVFGVDSPHYRHLKVLTERQPEHSYEVNQLIGLLTGGLDDLEKGYLIGQEFIIAGEVLDSVLEQAKHLNQSGHKDPAAVLARVVLENALKRLGREESVDEKLSASRINDELKRVGRYAQPQWRLVQAWLDTGNAAAHGKFSEYSQDDVTKLVEDIERFLAMYFHS
jgi:hypothetical protein